MTARPRTAGRTALAMTAGLLLLLAVGGCSHYRVAIPLAPGLALGLGAGKDGSYSVGLNTGFGPLGAGLAVNNGGVVSGSAGAGLGVGAGPVGAGVGVGKTVVLHDPKAAPGTGPVVLPATASANLLATAVPLSGSTPVAPPGLRVTRPSPSQATLAASTAPSSLARELGSPSNPVAP